MKLPENERLSAVEIEKQYRNSSASKLGNILMIDLQCDCDCCVESYEADNGGENVLYFSDGEWHIQHVNSILKVPMQYCPEITSAHIDSFWENISKVASVGKAKNPCECEYIKINGFAEWDLFFPPKEWFGCVSVNVGKIGIFCFIDRMFKVQK